MNCSTRSNGDSGDERIPTIPHLLVGAAGSLGATSLPQYLPLLQAFAALEVRVILTRSAESLVRPETLAIYCDQVVSETGDAGGLGDYLELVQWADRFIVLPATANLLGQAANGLATSKLSSAVLMWRSEVSFFPNMERTIWERPAVQRNVVRLREDGHVVVEPVSQPVYVASRRQIQISLSMPPPDRVIQLLRGDPRRDGMQPPIVPRTNGHDETVRRAPWRARLEN